MTAAIGASNPASAMGLPLALSIAFRELRAGAGGLVIFVLSIALGVAAVASIGSLAASFDQALARQGRLLVGGDLSFERVHRRASEEERAALDAQGTISESASLRAMARSADGKNALVEVKAVDGAYPLYGEVIITAPPGAGTPWREAGVVLVEQRLLDRRGAKVGDTVSIGEAKVRVAGTLGQQPDRLADRLAYGPKVLMSLETLERTGLILPGSLIRWIYRLKLPDNRGDDRAALKPVKSAIETKFPESGFAVTDWTDPAPSLREQVERFTQFISLVGLAALLLGGIGVGNAIGSYMAKKREVIATFKCLGATSRLVLTVYMIQALMLASIGIAIGLAVGAGAPWLLTFFYGEELPIELATELHPFALLTATLAGILTMLLFVLLPLGRASAVPPAVLMRAHLTDETERLQWRFAIAAALCGIALFVLGLAATEEQLITTSIAIGIVAALLLLWGFGWIIEKVAARYRRSKPPALSLAMTSIAAPGSIARQVAISLGLGLGFLIAIALIHRSLLTEFATTLEADTPAYYFLDVDASELPAFRKIALQAEPDAKLADAPMLRGRIVALNGVPAGKVKAAPDQRWVLSSDRGLTYTDTIPDASKIVEGEWWPKGYSGQPLVSFDAEAARGLDLKIGDTVTVNILGRNVEAKIANLRDIDWQSLAINFVMVFSPNTLAGAPHRVLTTIELPKGTTPEREAKMVQALAERFPLVTAINVGDVVDAARELLAKVMAAIRVTAGAVLFIGALVLAGAVTASQQQRQYQAVLYKTLGATRARILSAELLEFGLLGLVTAVFAVGVGVAVAWGLAKWAFDMKFIWSGWAAAETVLLALALMLGFGAVVTLKVLSAKAAPYLRGE